MEIDTQTVTIIVLIGNMVVNVFLAYMYRYRVKIETKQTQIQEENAEARRCLREFRKYMKIEEEEILKMSQEELKEFVDGLKHLGE